MNPDNLPIDWPLVGVRHVIHPDRASDDGSKVLHRDLGGRFVARAHVRGPKILVVTVLGAGEVSIDPGGSFGGVVPAGTVERHVPVAGLGEVEGTVGEKVDAVELFG